MIELDFVFDVALAAHDVDASSASVMDLRYSFLPGDVIFRVGEADFSARWGWVPLFDFALALRAICRDVTSAPQTFEFTESDATLQFACRSSIVRITASFTPTEAHVDLDDLTSAADRLVNRVVDAALARYPELTHNAAFADILENPGRPAAPRGATEQ